MKVKMVMHLGNVASLSPNPIVHGIDGETWINKKRIRTNKKENVMSLYSLVKKSSFAKKKQ